MAKNGEHLQYLGDLFENGGARAHYLINWSKKYRYIYVETPKVACTTIKRTLQNAEVEGDPSVFPIKVHERKNSPIPMVGDDLPGFKNLLANPNTFTFCFVRNPFTRVLSCYLDKMVRTVFERNRLAPTLNLPVDKAPEFIDFLRAIEGQPAIKRDIHWSAQSFLLRPRKFRYSFVGRFESFDTHFNAACKHLNIMDYVKPAKVFHATNANELVNQYLGPKEIRLIQEIYKVDFQNFGYGHSPPIF